MCKKNTELFDKSTMNKFIHLHQICFMLVSVATSESHKCCYLAIKNGVHKPIVQFIVSQCGYTSTSYDENHSKACLPCMEY